MRPVVQVTFNPYVKDAAPHGIRGSTLIDNNDLAPRARGMDAVGKASNELLSTWDMEGSAQNEEQVRLQALVRFLLSDKLTLERMRILMTSKGKGKKKKQSESGRSELWVIVTSDDVPTSSYRTIAGTRPLDERGRSGRPSPRTEALLKATNKLARVSIVVKKGAFRRERKTSETQLTVARTSRTLGLQARREQLVPRKG